MPCLFALCASVELGHDELFMPQRFGGGGAAISPLVYAAIPVLIIPIVLQSKQASNQRQAIALYNSGTTR